MKERLDGNEEGRKKEKRRILIWKFKKKNKEFKKKNRKKNQKRNGRKSRKETSKESEMERIKKTRKKLAPFRRVLIHICVGPRGRLEKFFI